MGFGFVGLSGAVWFSQVSFCWFCLVMFGFFAVLQLVCLVCLVGLMVFWFFWCPFFDLSGVVYWFFQCLFVDLSGVFGFLVILEREKKNGFSDVLRV